MKFLTVLSHPVLCYFIPLSPKYLPQNPILSLYSVLSVTDQGLHPYQTAGKFILLFIIIFTFFNSKWEDKILNWMVASISCVHSAPNLFMNAIF